MTAITRTSMVCPRLIEFGSMRVFHQTLRIPAMAAMKDANANASVRWRTTL